MKGMARSARQLLPVVLLCLAAVWSTLHSPTIFFDNQILLGPSLGVFALLQFGWRGLPVGLAAALTTVPLWGHPWAALILVLQLLWQQLFLSRLNGGRKQVGNGRIVLATIGFWLVLGLPLKALLYTGLLQTDLATALALGFKEFVVAVVNAALGLSLYLAVQLLPQRRGASDRSLGADLSLRGLIFTTLLLVISLPAVLIIMAMGQQITAQTASQFRTSLERQAQTIAYVMPSGSRAIPRTAGVQPATAEELAFEAVAADGTVVSSDPVLFARLRRDYRPEAIRRFGPLTPELLVLPQEPTLLRRHRQGYWWLELSPAGMPGSGWSRITVVQPALQQMQLLTGLMRPSLQILGLVLIAAALFSELLTSLLAAQFNRMLGSLTTLAGGRGAAAVLGMPELQRTRLRELNRVVSLINRQGRVVNELSDQLRRSHEQLRQSERRHRLLADNALDVITISDPSGRPTYISPSIQQVRGWTVAEAMALPMDRHLKPEGCAYVTAALRQTRQAVEQELPLPSFRVELEQSCKDGSWIWTDVTSSCIVDEAGHCLGTMIVYRDISERKRLEGELLQRACIDDLTGLLNRRELLERLEGLLGSAGRRRDDELALLFLDLDLFKQINDSLGHAAGDTVLRTVADRVRNRLRSRDLAGRMGGDEMVVVLQGLSDLAAAIAVAETILVAIEQPIQGSDFEIAVSASVGVTLARPGESLDDLMARADIAMYQAKLGGRRIVPIS